MKMSHIFVLYVILTSLQGSSTGTRTTPKHFMLRATFSEVLMLTCKADTDIKTIRWVVDDKLTALVERNGSSCAPKEGSNSSFAYTCTEDEFQLTVPVKYTKYINGSMLLCRDPYGEGHSNSLTVYFTGTPEDCELTKSNGSPEDCKVTKNNGSAEDCKVTKSDGSMKKWLVLTSSIAAVLLLSTAILAANILKTKTRERPNFIATDRFESESGRIFGKRGDLRSSEMDQKNDDDDGYIVPQGNVVSERDGTNACDELDSSETDLVNIHDDGYLVPQANFVRIKTTEQLPDAKKEENQYDEISVADSEENDPSVNNGVDMALVQRNQQFQNVYSYSEYQKLNESSATQTEDNVKQQNVEISEYFVEQSNGVELKYNTTEERKLHLSKPKQITKQTIAVVNGEKCVLVANPDTGRLYAYPVTSSSDVKPTE